MSYICAGDKVRIYYEEQCFDEGEVTAVNGALITVDFYDWIERWGDDQFVLRDLYYEGIEVLVPIRRGTIVADFRPPP
jgi:hypothetical protein